MRAVLPLLCLAGCPRETPTDGSPSTDGSPGTTGTTGATGHTGGSTTEPELHQIYEGNYLTVGASLEATAERLVGGAPAPRAAQPDMLTLFSQTRYPDEEPESHEVRESGQNAQEEPPAPTQLSLF